MRLLCRFMLVDFLFIDCNRMKILELIMIIEECIIPIQLSSPVLAQTLAHPHPREHPSLVVP